MKNTCFEDVPLTGISHILQNRSKEFRAIADKLPHICFLTTAEGQNLWYNQPWVDYNGETASRHNWTNIIHSDDLPEFVKLWDQAVIKRKIFEHRFRLKSKTGQYRWFLCRANPISDSSFNVMGWLGTLTDIEGLTLPLDEKTEIIENMDVGYLTVDKNWSITEANSYHLKLVGKTREKEIGTHLIKNYLSYEGANKTDHYFHILKAMYKREAARFVDYYPPSDRWTYVNVHPRHDGGIVLFYRDISEEKRLCNSLPEKAKSITL